jgi:hypothetical protein
MAKRGLYENIRRKRARIKAGTKGAPTAKNFRQAAKTARRPKR